jgi:hypothetical protein
MADATELRAGPGRYPGVGAAGKGGIPRASVPASHTNLDPRNHTRNFL